MCFTIPPGAINTVPLLPKTAQPACLPPPALTSKHSRLCSTGPYMTAAAGPGWLKCSAGPSVTPTLAHKCSLKQGSDKNIMNKPSNSKERYRTLQPALLLVHIQNNMTKIVPDSAIFSTTVSQKIQIRPQIVEVILKCIKRHFSNFPFSFYPKKDSWTMCLIDSWAVSKGQSRHLHTEPYVHSKFCKLHGTEAKQWRKNLKKKKRNRFKLGFSKPILTSDSLIIVHLLKINLELPDYQLTKKQKQILQLWLFLPGWVILRILITDDD